MVDLETLVAEFFKHDQASIEAGKAYEEALVSASRKWVQYQHPNVRNISYDTMSVSDQILVHNDLLSNKSTWKHLPHKIPEGAPKAEVLAFHKAMDHSNKADRLYQQSHQALVKHLGVDSLDIVGDGDVMLLRKTVPVGDGLHDVREFAITKDRFTLEGLQRYKDHPVLQNSRIWKELPKGATPAVETWAEKVVKPVDKAVTAKPPVAESMEHFKSAIQHGNIDEYATILGESDHPSAETFARQTRKLSTHLKKIGAAAENGAITNIEAALNTLKRSKIVAQVENIASHIR